MAISCFSVGLGDYAAIYLEDVLSKEDRRGVVGLAHGVVLLDPRHPIPDTPSPSPVFKARG